MPDVAALDLLTVGETFEDVVFGGLARLPAEGEELVTPALERTLGGGALITAIGAARLGLRVGVISALPPSAARTLRAERVRVHDVRRPREPHATTCALVTPTDRAYVTYPGVNAQLPARAARLLAGARVRARHVHLAFPPRPAAPWARVVERLAARGITTSWDFGAHADLPRDPGFYRLLGALDLVSVNELEARLFTGERTVAAAVTTLASTCRRALVKLGADGARLVGPGVDLGTPARRVRVVDTVGAGDAFNAGFLAAWLGGSGPTACLAAGARVAAGSVGAAGGLAGLPRRRT